jgi:uncharacterized protein YmfQ (DUF2313 family)
VGLTVYSQADYAKSLRQLFPQGDFWDNQFADETSDLFRWTQAEAAELFRLKTRRADLLNEGLSSTANETLEDWERVLDLDNSTLTTEQRQQALSSISLGAIRKAQIESACAIFGASLDDLVYPYTPAFFGRSRFATRLATGAALSTVWIYMTIEDSSQKASLVAHLEKILLGNMILSFFFKEADGEYHVS